MLQLNYRDARPIYEQIKEEIQKLLITNAISADEKLPSVRELASSLAINPNTIQRAYRELEAEGYVYTLPGKGTFASAIDLVNNTRTRELFTAFDSAAKELLTLSVSKEELIQRLENMEQERMSGND